MINIDHTSFRSRAFDRRVRFLVLHYTAGNFAASVAALTGENVSSHYLVPNLKDKTYIDAGFKELRIFNLVDESERAWHAGVSSWGNRNNINDTSIGIEIVNEASFQNGEFTFPPYPAEQIQVVMALVKNILERYPYISPTNVIGHSDIAPGRKTDPGPYFPWKELYDAGLGAWYDEETKNDFLVKFRKKIPERAVIVKMLKDYGYNTRNLEASHGFKDLIQSFQLHFRPQDCNGKADSETMAILAALLKKYHNK